MTTPDRAAIRAALEAAGNPIMADWYTAERLAEMGIHDCDVTVVLNAPEWLTQLCEALDAEELLAARLSDDLDNEREFREADQRLMDTWVELAERRKATIAALRHTLHGGEPR